MAPSATARSGRDVSGTVRPKVQPLGRQEKFPVRPMLVRGPSAEAICSSQTAIRSVLAKLVAKDGENLVLEYFDTPGAATSDRARRSVPRHSLRRFPLKSETRVFGFPVRSGGPVGL